MRTLAPWLAALCLVCACETTNEATVPDTDSVTVTDTASDSVLAEPFEEFAWQSEAPDPTRDRLCPAALDPVGAEEKMYIDCAMEGADFTTSSAAPKDELDIWAYNIERGFHIDAQAALMLEDPEVPLPDIVLVSESDRGCARTERRNVLRDYAEMLGMYYVYAVEFVELAGADTNDLENFPGCEHGNGILSRYPLGNVAQMRHATDVSWYQDPDPETGIYGGGEPRLGSRVAVLADVKVGDRILHLYTLHFYSDIDETIREAQAIEVAEHALTRPHPVVAGGDLNAGLFLLNYVYGEGTDPTTNAFLERGFEDAHAALAKDDRYTHPHGDGGTILDFVLVRGVEVIDAAVGDRERFEDLSDHLPVWTTVSLTSK